MVFIHSAEVPIGRIIIFKHLTREQLGAIYLCGVSLDVVNSNNWKQKVTCKSKDTSY